MATFDDFEKLDIRVGTIISAKNFEKARKPAYQLEIDFGDEIGVKRSSAQITGHYAADELPGKQVLAVMNFPPRQIANFFSGFFKNWIERVAAVESNKKSDRLLPV